jgi:hypothetical protein
MSEIVCDGNIQLRSPFGLWTKLLCGILKQSCWKVSFCGSVELPGNVAVHVPTVSIATCPPTVEGSHAAAAPCACLKSGFLLAKEFCIIGIILAPKTSIDAIAATIRIPLIVWFIFFVIIISNTYIYTD